MKEADDEWASSTIASSTAWIAIMPHEVWSMSMMQDPTQCLSEHVGWVDDSREVYHDEVTEESPMLKRKIANLDVT